MNRLSRFGTRVHSCYSAHACRHGGTRCRAADIRQVERQRLEPHLLARGAVPQLQHRDRPHDPGRRGGDPGYRRLRPDDDRPGDQDHRTVGAHRLVAALGRAATTTGITINAGSNNNDIITLLGLDVSACSSSPCAAPAAVRDRHTERRCRAHREIVDRQLHAGHELVHSSQYGTRHPDLRRRQLPARVPHGHFTQRFRADKRRAPVDRNRQHAHRERAQHCRERNIGPRPHRQFHRRAAQQHHCRSGRRHLRQQQHRDRLVTRLRDRLAHHAFGQRGDRDDRRQQREPRRQRLELGARYQHVGAATRPRLGPLHDERHHEQPTASSPAAALRRTWNRSAMAEPSGAT